MTEQTATLLSFPARDDDRLRLALRRLVSALDSQAEAVAALRGELRSLAVAMNGLKGSFTAYGSELDATAIALREAGAGARTLERTADGWLAATKG